MYSSSGKNNRTLRYPMLTLFDEVNRFIEDVIPAAQSSRAHSAFNPPVDVTETQKEYVLRAEFPGLTAESVNIELRDNSITLSGEKRHECEKGEDSRHYVERSYGSFSRTVTFDAEVDEDNALAELKDGLLTVTIPKAAREIKGTKRLAIKTS